MNTDAVDIVRSPAGNGDSYLVAVISRAPGTAEMRHLRERGVDGVWVNLQEAGMPESDLLRLLEELEGVRYLDVISSKCPSLPQPVLCRLETLGLSARHPGTTLLATSALTSIKSLEINPRLLSGDLCECRSLDTLQLNGVTSLGLGVVEGCDELRLLRVVTRAPRTGAFGWKRPPLQLVEIQTRGLVPSSFSGIQELPALRRLMMRVPRNTRLSSPLSMTPLGLCASLEVIALENLRPLVDRASITGLPNLQTVNIVGCDP